MSKARTICRCSHTKYAHKLWAGPCELCRCKAFKTAGKKRAYEAKARALLAPSAPAANAKTVESVEAVLRALLMDSHAEPSQGQEFSRYLDRAAKLGAEKIAAHIGQALAKAERERDALRVLRQDCLDALDGSAGADAGDGEIVSACNEWKYAVRLLPEGLLDPEADTLQEIVAKLLTERDEQPYGFDRDGRYFNHRQGGAWILRDLVLKIAETLKGSP